MKKPTLEEVKDHFKDAKVVKDNNGDKIDLTENGVIIEEEGRGWYACKHNNEDVRLYHQNPSIQEGYAEIIEYKNQDREMKKVIRLDEPKEEKQPKPIELTHYITDKGYWSELNRDFKGYSKIIYLGHCTTDGDKFACYHSSGKIEIWKGHLNDGVY